MKKIIFLVLSLIITFVFVSTPLFSNEGKNLFIQNCLNCHREGGKADPVNPADKAGRVWKKFFKRGRHPETDKLISTIGEDKFQKILNYLIDNAADSDHPEAAVIPK